MEEGNWEGGLTGWFPLYGSRASHPFLLLDWKEDLLRIGLGESGCLFLNMRYYDRFDGSEIRPANSGRSLNSIEKELTYGDTGTASLRGV